MTTFTTNAEICVAGPDESSWFSNVADDVFDDPLIAERLTEFLGDPRHHLVAARSEGAVVGFISAVLYVHPDKPSPELWINEVGVAPSHQRRGLAKAMLTTLLDHARGLGCADAWVLTDRANTAAMALYSACGGAAPTDQVMIEFDLDERRPSGHQAR
ncbi:MAG TPA: GNAT family N-acetyltransferase [Candidatus Binatia bacterium]|nr:GNAT family N-acetyltransferase [Candidatus Binatia bacterium]